jgi:hypothetical protein
MSGTNFFLFSVMVNRAEDSKAGKKFNQNIYTCNLTTRSRLSFSHLKTGHKFVCSLNVSSFRRSGFWMFTVFHLRKFPKLTSKMQVSFEWGNWHNLFLMSTLSVTQTDNFFHQIYIALNYNVHYYITSC